MLKLTNLLRTTRQTTYSHINAQLRKTGPKILTGCHWFVVFDFEGVRETHFLTRDLSSSTSRHRELMERKQLKLGKLETMQLDTPEFKSLFTPEFTQLKEVFEKYNYEIRIAGGAVRDLLRRILPEDIDFATTATPDQMKDMFTKEKIRMINTKGESHGTITARINDKENFEVTTLRIDLRTDGRHAEVEFTKDWQVDANRRDLTINSMFLGLDGTLYDYFNGRHDLEEQRVRFVGDARERIREDYLRILRYFRFYGKIASTSNNFDHETLEIIQNNGEGLKGVAGERIWMEVTKIFNGNFANSIIRTVMDCKIGQYIGFPGNPNLDELDAVYARCKHLNPHHMTLVAALLRTEDDIKKLRERVKFSNEELKTANLIMEHRDSIIPDNDVQKYCQDLLCDTIGNDKKVKAKILELLKYKGLQKAVEDFSQWDMPQFPVNGRNLIDAGIHKGPAMSRMLNLLRTIWKDSKYTMTEQELLKYAKDVMSKK